MTQASRVETTARALGDRLEALADALGQVRAEDMAECAASLAQRTRDFGEAVNAAGADGGAAGGTSGEHGPNDRAAPSLRGHAGGAPSGSGAVRQEFDE